MTKLDFQIFDNEGESFDRYTLIDGDGDMFGFSENPFSPQGFNQFCGKAPQETEHLGKRVELKDLPISVYQAIQDRLWSA